MVDTQNAPVSSHHATSNANCEGPDCTGPELQDGSSSQALDNITSAAPYGNMSTAMETKQYLEYHISMAIVTYLFPVVIATGTVGNCVSFIVLMRRRLRNTSAYVYLAGLACADNGVLLLSAFKTWIRAVFKWELLHVSDAGCKIIMCLFLVSLHLSAWLIVAMTTDRFVVVWLPFKSSILCNGKRAKVTTACLVIVMIIYNLHVFWTLGLRSYNGGKITACGPSHEDYFMTEIFPYLKLVSYSILPFTIVLILNLCIIWRLWSTRQSLTEKTVRTEAGCPSRRSQNRITVMLLTVSCLWLLLTAPFTMWSLLWTHSTDPRQKAQTFLFKTLCFLFLYINHGINFYLYCCTGRRFRRDLHDVICVTCSRWVRRTFSTKTGSTTTAPNNYPLVRRGSPWDTSTSTQDRLNANKKSYL